MLLTTHHLLVSSYLIPIISIDRCHINCYYDSSSQGKERGRRSERNNELHEGPRRLPPFDQIKRSVSIVARLEGLEGCDVVMMVAS